MYKKQDTYDNADDVVSEFLFDGLQLPNSLLPFFSLRNPLYAPPGEYFPLFFGSGSVF
jgi:hypothetical protein